MLRRRGRPRSGDLYCEQAPKGWGTTAHYSAAELLAMSDQDDTHTAEYNELVNEFGMNGILAVAGAGRVGDAFDPTKCKVRVLRDGLKRDSLEKNTQAPEWIVQVALPSDEQYLVLFENGDVSTADVFQLIGTVRKPPFVDS
jgi:hypothetical protein